MSFLKRFKKTEKENAHLMEVRHYEELKSANADDLNNIIATYDIGESQQVLDVAVDANCRHIVALQNECALEDIEISRFINAHPDEFWTAPVEYIIEHTQELANEQLNLNFCEIIQKKNMISEIEKFVSGKNSINSTLVTDILNVSDELISNAIFNAPKMNTENSNVGFDRHCSQAKMGEGKVGSYDVVLTEKNVYLKCEDPYGSLNVKAYLDRIRKCYEKGLGESINMGPGGAQIGAFMVYNLVRNLYIGVETKQKTIICCVIPLEKSGKKRSLQPKSLHVCHR